MNLWQAFKMAFKSIAMKKTRSFLTMLGIIIGVASVVIMVSVVAGQNKQQMAYMEMMGNNMVEVNASSWTGQDMDQTVNDYVATLGSNLVVGISPNINLWSEMIIRYGGKSFSTQNWEKWEDMIQVVLGNDAYGVCNDYALMEGRELSFLDVEKTNKVCVLGGGAKKILFDFVDPVGETIFINSQPFLVVGWYESMGVTDYSELDNIVLLPYTFNRTLNNNNTMDSYIVKGRDAKATVEAKTRIEAFLNGVMPLDENGNRQNGYAYVGSNDSYAQEQEKANLMESLRFLVL